ncbi:MAG: ABC transporter ATP-binding protein [Acetobacteraceae bacterium]
MTTGALPAIEVSGLGKIFTNTQEGPAGGIRDVTFSLKPGTFFTLLGPSGCGKTTTLRCVAGLELPDRGTILVGDQTLFDDARAINMPLNRRNIGMVFQSYAIWPHMTVFENVAFSLRARGVARSELGGPVRRSLDLVGLGDLADRPATRLSGGQQQRVALARAIAGDPGVILLDEPLSNLDAQLRLTMRAEFKALHRRLGLTAIYVTHDQEEALVLSDRVVVMRDGLIEQTGTPAEIHDAPRSRFVATFVGVRNIIPCEAADGQAMLPNGVRLAVHGAPPAGPVCVCFRPINLRLSGEAQPGAHPAVLTGATYLGDMMQYELMAGEISLCARTLPRGDLALGATVWWSVVPDACFFVSA